MMLSLLQGLLDQPSLNHTNKAYIFVGMADCYRFSDQPEESLRAYQQAQKLNPDNVYAQVGLGNAYFLMGYKQKAKECFQHALKKEAKNRYALAGLVKVEKSLAQNPEDEPKLLPVVSAEASVTAPPVMITKLTQRPRRIVTIPERVDPVEALRMRIAVNSADIGAHFLLASILVQRKNPDEAAFHLWTILEHDKHHTDSVRLLRQIGKPPERPVDTKNGTPASCVPSIHEMASVTSLLTPTYQAVSAPAKKIENSTCLEEVDLDVVIDGARKTICRMQIEIPADIDMTGDWRKAIRISILTECPQTKLYKSEPAIETHPQNVVLLHPKAG